MNYKRKSRRRFFLLVRSRTPPISSEFRGGGLNTPNPPSRYATGFYVGKENKLTRKLAVLKIAMMFGTDFFFNGELDQTKTFIITCVLTVPLGSITLRNARGYKLTPSSCLFTYRPPMCCGLKKAS